MQPPQRKRSADFRYVYSNVFGVQLTTNELIVNFGLSEDVSRPEESNLEQVSVVLTLQSAKTLLTLLRAALEKLEADTGITIPLDETKVQKIVASMKTSQAAKPPDKRR